MVRNYSSIASETTLAAAITAASTAIQVTEALGFPVQFPFTLVIDHDNESKEIVDVVAQSGTTLTIARGKDGTAASAHSLGAKVRHDHSARDFREPQQHIDGKANVHGLSGGAEVVGTTQLQTLSNKTLDGTTTYGGDKVVERTKSQTVTNKTFQSSDFTAGSNDFPDFSPADTGWNVISQGDLANGWDQPDSGVVANIEPLAWRRIDHIVELRGTVALNGSSIVSGGRRLLVNLPNFLGDRGYALGIHYGQGGAAPGLVEIGDFAAVWIHGPVDSGTPIAIHANWMVAP